MLFLLDSLCVIANRLLRSQDPRAIQRPPNVIPRRSFTWKQSCVSNASWVKRVRHGQLLNQRWWTCIYERLGRTNRATRTEAPPHENTSFFRARFVALACRLSRKPRGRGSYLASHLSRLRVLGHDSPPASIEESRVVDGILRRVVSSCPRRAWVGCH